jgi:hypothetical protein
MTARVPPPDQEDQADLFGPSPYARFSTALQRFFSNRRALRITAILLLSLEVLGQFATLFTTFSYLRAFPRETLHYLSRLLGAGCFAALFIACVVMVLRSPLRGIPIAIGAVAARGYFVYYNQAAHWLGQLTQPTEAAGSPLGLLDLVVPILALLLPPFIIFVLYKLACATPPEPRAPPIPSAPFPVGPEHFPPPSLHPVLAYQDPAEPAFISRRTIVMILLWTTAGIRAGGFVVTVLIDTANRSTLATNIWKLETALGFLGPILGAALPALWMRKPHAKGILIVIGLTLGFGAPHLAALLDNAAQTLASLFTSFFDTTQLLYLLWAALLASLYAATIWSLVRLLVALQKRLPDPAGPISISP